MDLNELSIKEFMELLASERPAPGGGAAAALAGCIGCALIEMVVSLTKGKKRYEEFETLMAETGEKSEKLRHKLLEAVNRDADAYSLVSAAHKMERATDEQIERREKAIESALKKALEAPLELMKLIGETIVLCEGAVGKSNPNVASDLRVSAEMLRAAALSAHINVLVNIEGIHDAEFNKSRLKESKRVLSAVLDAADRIVDNYR